uniref:Uncharacterized protein n=1 Tax=Desulfomonile tiedjei TaxID=2358 RepID=A0A7C4EYQ4_9BACT
MNKEKCRSGLPTGLSKGHCRIEGIQYQRTGGLHTGLQTGPQTGGAHVGGMHAATGSGLHLEIRFPGGGACQGIGGCGCITGATAVGQPPGGHAGA